MALPAQTRTHIEVYKFSLGTVFGAAFFALLLQAFLPVRFPNASLLELPLLVTLYFGLSRRNPSKGLLLGTTIGLLQDAISGANHRFGLYGIAKTFVGYGASSLGGRLDTEHPLSRFFLTFLFFFLHQAILATAKRLLLAQPEPFFNKDLLLAAALNAVLAVALFPLLDRLRKHT
jgi:rod shape-determining protein MreD